MPQGWAFVRKALFTVVLLGASEIGSFSEACDGRTEVVPSP